MLFCSFALMYIVHARQYTLWCGEHKHWYRQCTHWYYEFQKCHRAAWGNIMLFTAITQNSVPLHHANMGPFNTTHILTFLD